MKKKAILYGATGLIGRYLLEGLLKSDSYDAVYVIARRPLSQEHPKLTTLVCPGEKLHELTLALGPSDAYCALGTTIKQAGSREKFKLVDHDFVFEFAKLALRAGARHLILVSALGADENSMVFYCRIKGETERDVAALGFDEVTIARPSLLLGKRDSFRPGESIGQLLSPLMVGPLRALQGIDASDVALAMLKLAEDSRSQKVRIVPSNELRNLAKGS